MSDPNLGSAISGQLSLSKPVAFSNTLLSTLRTNSLLRASSVRAGHGMAKSLFPIFKKPPNESTAYAIRPEFTSIIRSSIFPRLSPAAFLTRSLLIELLESTLGYLVFSILSFPQILKYTISETKRDKHRHYFLTTTFDCLVHFRFLRE